LRLATCDLRLATCDLRLATCDLRLATCDLRLATCDLRLATCDFRLATCDFRLPNIRCGGVDIQIDLGAEILVAAEKAGEKIAVEIKNFVSASKISEFHMALGQFINYRTALRTEEPSRNLYLAVPLVTYNDFFNQFGGFKSPGSINKRVLWRGLSYKVHRGDTPPG
jgi:XisH protein